MSSTPDDFTAWLNGEFLPLSQASLSVLDAGVTGGIAVTERLRTFRHVPFLLNEHLERLAASAEAAYVPLPLSTQTIGELVCDVVQRNAARIGNDDDLSVSVFATAGINSQPSLCLHATRIPARDYAEAFERGLRLVTPATQAILPDSLSPQIKTRSRLHWHIADAQADRFDPGAKALLLDRDGFVTETATGNVFVVDENGARIRTPRRTRTLHGISQRYLMALQPGIAEADLHLDDLWMSDEVFVTSSISCLLPVVTLNRTPIGDGRPGATFRRLLENWSYSVGVDIAGQMRQMAETNGGR